MKINIGEAEYVPEDACFQYSFTDRETVRAHLPS